jgi:hypothetical protein
MAGILARGGGTVGEYPDDKHPHLDGRFLQQVLTVKLIKSPLPVWKRAQQRDQHHEKENDDCDDGCVHGVVDPGLHSCVGLGAGRDSG